MDHELKQRLIGAAVVTALCAIFIPMLFDDPVDNSGQLVSELSIPAPIASEQEPAGKLPTHADQVLKLPDSEPLANEAAGDVIESTGAEEEAAEPEVDKAKQGHPGEALYAESEGYTPDDADTEQPLPKAHPKPSDSIQHKPIAAESVKTMVPKTSHIETPVKAKKVVETVKPVLVKKPEKSSGSGHVASDSESTAPATVSKQPSSAKNLAAAVAESKKPEGTPKSTPKLVRWYVQVGSFSKKENATSLFDSLHDQGLPASLDTVQTDKGTTYRLRVGPELDGKKAAAMKARLDKQNIKAILISE